jgi:hypothetical protein
MNLTNKGQHTGVLNIVVLETQHTGVLNIVLLETSQFFLSAHVLDRRDTIFRYVTSSLPPRHPQEAYHMNGNKTVSALF